VTRFGRRLSTSFRAFLKARPYFKVAEPIRFSLRMVLEIRAMVVIQDVIVVDLWPSWLLMG
jgi:hypothetical protein